MAAPRAVVGLQSEGATADSVTIESDIDAAARDSVVRSGLAIIDVAPSSEELGHTNVVFIDAGNAMTAASDQRSDGAAVVAHYPRIVND